MQYDKFNIQYTNKYYTISNCYLAIRNYVGHCNGNNDDNPVNYYYSNNANHRGINHVSSNYINHTRNNINCSCNDINHSYYNQCKYSRSDCGSFH